VKIVSEGAGRVTQVRIPTKTSRIEGESAKEQTLIDRIGISEDLSDVGPKSAENNENR
jgi:hypothetical protein